MMRVHSDILITSDKPTRKECIARDISVFVMIASFSIHPLVYLLPH